MLCCWFIINIFEVTNGSKTPRYLKKLDKFLFIVLLGLVFYLDANSQIDSLPVRLAGRVESVDSAFQLPYVHVINKRTGMGVITDTVGVFKTTLLASDTLIFRCMGFDDRFYTLPDSLNSNYLFVKLNMGPKSYRIKEVEVLALTPQHQFKYDFINMPIKEQDWPNQDLYIEGVNNPNYRKLREAERPIYPTYVGGPLAWAYKMSSKSKSLEELARLVNEDRMLEAANKKYNMDILGEFTGFTGDTLFAFFTFLGFSAKYIFDTPEYNIYLEILRKIPQFEAHIKSNGLPFQFIDD